MLNLRRFVPRFLTFFVSGLCYNILVHITFFTEIEKFKNFVGFFGSQTMRHHNISESRNILLPIFYNQQIVKKEHSKWHPQCNPEQICCLFLQSSLVDNRNASYAVQSGHNHRLRHPASWGKPVYHSHYWVGPDNPSSSPRVSAAISVAIQFSLKVQNCNLHPLQWVFGSQWLGKGCSASSSSSWLPLRHYIKEDNMIFSKVYMWCNIHIHKYLK